MLYFFTQMPQPHFAIKLRKYSDNMISVQEAADRKQRIRDVAYQLFRERGVERVTYRDIAKLSKICESSIYHYYPQKSDILLATHKDLWVEIETKLRESTVKTEQYQAATGYQQISQLIDGFVDVYEDHYNYLKFAVECKIYWNHQSSAIDGAKYDEILRPAKLMFSDALRKGTKDGSVYLDKDIEASCFLLWGMLRAYMEQIVIYDGFYKGENLYKKHFATLKYFILKFYERN